MQTNIGPAFFISNISFLQGGDEFKHKLELRLIKADQQDAQFQHYFQVEIYVV